MPDEVVVGTFLPPSPLLDGPERPLTPDVEALLATTFDQLRTFTVVCQVGNVRAAARSMQRDHSSVRKQLDTLEERFHDAARGRLLVHSTNRGGGVHVTDAGRRVQAFADTALRALDASWTELLKAQRDRPLRFAIHGFASYLVPLLARIHADATREFAQRGVRYRREVVPVRNMDTQAALLERADLDFAFGGMMCRRADSPALEDSVDFTEWSRDDMFVLSNIDVGATELTSRTVMERRIPLVAPRQGIIYELLVAELDEGERNQLNVVEWCDDGAVAVGLLTHGLCNAAIICTNRFADYAKAQSGSEHLIIVPYRCDWQHRFGLFARKTDIEAWAPNHPARVFWEVFVKVAAERRDGVQA